MDFREQTKKYLTEGIEYFKYSKRFIKLAKKMEDNIDYAIEDKEEILSLIQELKEAAKDFKEAEEEYKESHYYGMLKYKVLKSQYKHLIKEAKKESIRKFLFSIGMLGALGFIASFLESK